MDKTALAHEKHDTLVLAQIIVQRFSSELSDSEALAAPLGLEIWFPDRFYGEGQKIRHGERLPGIPQLYEIKQPGGVTSQEHQKPDSSGMLAVYRPIVPTASGTIDDPIPYVAGMDCCSGLYYIDLEITYLCIGDLIPCPANWRPGSPGMWQWKIVEQ